MTFLPHSPQGDGNGAKKRRTTPFPKDRRKSGLLTSFFKSNLDDAREMATRMVRQELSDHIEPLIQAEDRNIQRTFRTEQIVSNTGVDYYAPTQPSKEPLEYALRMDGASQMCGCGTQARNLRGHWAAFW